MQLATAFRRSKDLKCFPALLSLESSLHKWATLTFLGWGIFATLKAADACRDYLDQSRMLAAGVLFVLSALLKTLSMALFLARFLFLIRWHTTSRIGRLRTNPGITMPVQG
jgi:hypothetical protein